MPAEDSVEQPESNLYQILECGADGKPGGILITSLGQEVYPHIWLGGYKALESQHFLEKNHIKHILSLGHFKQLYTPGQYCQKIVPVTDHPEADIIQYFPQVIQFIQDALDKGESILVHCLAGVSRSPTVVAAYLMATQKLRWKEALAMIKRTRPFVNPNPGFVAQLKLFQTMGYLFDLNHPAYLDYKKQHPVDAGHVGHSEYNV